MDRNMNYHTSDMNLPENFTIAGSDNYGYMPGMSGPAMPQATVQPQAQPEYLMPEMNPVPPTPQIETAPQQMPAYPAYQSPAISHPVQSADIQAPSSPAMPETAPAIQNTNNTIQTDQQWYGCMCCYDGQQGDEYADPDMRDFMEQGYLMSPNCFGRNSQVYADELIEFITDEYRDCLYYTALSKRVSNKTAKRIFALMAADEKRHSRRFGAAYFLITGQKYSPAAANIPPVYVPPTYSQALRDRYIAESRDAIKYRQFAAETSDMCLKRMAENTSDDEKRHAQELLELIQNLS